jgi:nucleotide-binding universal stress UspA family protein
MLHSIAVTTDFSTLSRQAFAAAAALGRKHQARLYLLHVLPPPEIVKPWQLVNEPPAELDARRAAAEARLEELVTAETAFAGLDVRLRVLQGEPAEAASRFLKLEEIELVVIASHGWTGAERFPLGSFTAKVLELTTCPVLVFRATSGESSGLPGFHPKRFLVPHDFSQASGVALEVARSWARDFDAAVRLIFVADDRHLSGGSSEAGARVRAEGMERLERLVLEEWRGITAEAVAHIGHPAVEILEEAQSFRADLIVLASRGLSALERLAIGSTAERVIQGARCPVLVVKRRREELLG